MRNKYTNRTTLHFFNESFRLLVIVFQFVTTFKTLIASKRVLSRLLDFDTDPRFTRQKNIMKMNIKGGNGITIDNSIIEQLKIFTPMQRL